MHRRTVFEIALCAAALLAAVGCAALEEGYTTRYGLTSTENPQQRESPVDEGYGSGIVGIQDIEEYEEKYQKKDIMRPGEPAEPSTQ